MYGMGTTYRVLYYSIIRVIIRVLCMWTRSRIGVQKAYGCKRLEVCAWNCLLSSFWPIVLATAHYHSVYTFICNIIYIQAKPYRVPLCLCGLCAGWIGVSVCARGWIVRKHKHKDQMMVSRSSMYTRNTYIHTAGLNLKPMSGHVLFYYTRSQGSLYYLLYSINLIRVLYLY